LALRSFEEFSGGKGRLSRPIASIRILESTHFLIGEEVWTRGKCLVCSVFKDDKIHFEGYKKLK
jgi:hypothetical protein